MKIYLDDVRPTPDGWVRCYWPEEVITLLQANPGKVTHLSLDHDLGDLDNDQRNGYAVLLWLEQEVALNGFIPPQTITVHSDNSSARIKMESAIKAIRRLHQRNQQN